MKLNPSKYAFGVASGKLQAILDITSPKTVKEVQKLTGRITALNKFVSKATNKCLPLDRKSVV